MAISKMGNRQTYIILLQHKRITLRHTHTLYTYASTSNTPYFLDINDRAINVYTDTHRPHSLVPSFVQYFDSHHFTFYANVSTKSFSPGSLTIQRLKMAKFMAGSIWKLHLRDVNDTLKKVSVFFFFIIF